MFSHEVLHVGDLQPANLAPGQLVHFGHAGHGQLPALPPNSLGETLRKSPRVRQKGEAFLFHAAIRAIHAPVFEVQVECACSRRPSPGRGACVGRRNAGMNARNRSTRFFLAPNQLSHPGFRIALNAAFEAGQSAEPGKL